MRQPNIKLSQEIKNFIHCATAGPSAPNHHTGVPDGSCIPSFVRDHRVRYVLRPDGGEISFALQPGPYGALCLRRGTTSMYIPRYTAATGTNVTPFLANLTGDNTWPQLPFPILPTTLGTKPFGPTGATGFRIIACVAGVHYTGSSMMDGGHWQATTHAVTPVVANGATTVGGRTGGKHIMAAPSAAVMRADSASGNMRNMPVLRALPNSYEYQSILENQFYMDSSGAPLLNPQVMQDASSTISAGFTPGVYHRARGVVFSAAGLDASASITVDLRVCIEYQIDMFASPYQDLVGPSPPAVPGFLDMFKNVIRDTPVVELIDTVGKHAIKTASSYLSGQLARLH